MAEAKENTAAEKATGIDRREAMLRILRLAGIGAGTVAAGYWLSARSARPVEQLVVGARRDHTIAANAALPELAVIRGGNPRELVQRALEEMGGIRRFIGRTDVVIVKPNIAWTARRSKQRTRIRKRWRKWCGNAGKRARKR